MSGTWKTMSDEEKKFYEKMAKLDEARFLKEKKEFDQTGFFTNIEGVHSSKLEAKHKKSKKDSGEPKKLSKKQLLSFHSNFEAVRPKRYVSSWMCYYMLSRSTV